MAKKLLFLFFTFFTLNIYAQNVTMTGTVVDVENLLHIPADTRSAFPVISVQSPVSIQCCWQS